MISFELFSTLFLSIAGSAAVARWVGRVSAEALIERTRARFAVDIETHRTTLKKSELIFEKQFQAASALFVLKNEIMPKPRPGGLDSDEAYEEIALHLSKIAGLLNGFLVAHGVILPKEARDSLVSAMYAAGEYAAEGDSVEPSAASVKVAEELFSTILQVEQLMIDVITKQSSAIS